MTSIRFTFILATGLALLLTNTVHAGPEAIQFGPRQHGRIAVPSENSLSQATTPPSRELALGSEIMVVSGYEPGASGTVKVHIDRPGARVLLVLTAYESVRWQISSTPRTSIAAILTGGYYESSLESASKVPAYRMDLPYSYEKDNANFHELLSKLHAQFGVERVHAFRGQYRLPAQVSIAEVDAPHAALTLAGTPARPAPVKLEFKLRDSSGVPVSWTLSGPVSPNEAHGYSDAPIAFAGSTGQRQYLLKNDSLTRIDHDSGEETRLDLPSDFPRFSWAMDLAHDSKRNLVTVVSLGGEGFLYRYDATQRKWMDYRSLNNIDLYSLTYDRSADRYIAWSDRGDLIFISPTGDVLFSRNVLAQLEGFGRLYDRGNSRTPRLRLVGAGNAVALLYQANHQILRIWHYDVSRNVATLTYSAS
ncbi:hypothetical protein KSF73_05120 [Burkholderiaceae bacterium DAT-1]|nr:hypothetical protein [Burkholderiaceae bacterium DAT-1]